MFPILTPELYFWSQPRPIHYRVNSFGSRLEVTDVQFFVGCFLKSHTAGWWHQRIIFQHLQMVNNALASLNRVQPHFQDVDKKEKKNKTLIRLPLQRV